MPSPIRIVLADDHLIVRQGTAELLRREPDLEVVGEAGDGLQAIELTRALKPDLVVMDVRMPVLSGIEATRRIREAMPQVFVLVLTAHDDEQYIFKLLQAGANGYLLKTAPASELVKAIRQVVEGGMPLDPTIAQKVVLKLSGPAQATDDTTQSEALDLGPLTARELELVQLLAQGLSNRAIAEALGISERTVQSHLTNIFAKLRVGSRLEAVLLAIRRGWLKLES
jgi:DNA-binding NarL/FixJ family response regulator